MKKIIIGLVAAGILVFLGILVFKRSGGPSQAAALAPGDSVAFLNIPNIPLTGFRWSKSALAKIAAEKEVRDFLELPMRQIQEAPGADETKNLLVALKPGNVFLAAVEGSENSPRLLAGVQFWGKREDFDKAVARLRETLPAGDAPVRSEHRGLEILTTHHDDLVLMSAAAGRWGFLSNDETLLHGAIDRATGNSAGDGLSRNTEFLKVSSELLNEPDLLAYIRMDAAVEGLLAAGNAAGAVPIPDQVEQLKSTLAIGGSWKIDGNLQRDAVFFLRPSTGELPQPMEHLAMELTRPETMVYFDFQLDLSKLPGWIESFADIHPDAAAAMLPVAQKIAGDFGPECALFAEWPAENILPSPILALQMRNPANDLLASSAPWLPMASAQTINNRTVHIFSSLHTNLAASQNERFLAVGTDPAMVAEALDGHSQTLRDAPAFQSAKSALKSANEAFGFIDTRAVFERGYSSMIPVIQLSAAMMPDLSQRMDVSKLPKPETIGQHLPPIFFSQSRTSDGTRFESSGPVSMSQFLILAGAASGAIGKNPFGP